MLQDAPAFSGFSTNDIPKTKVFYEQMLGLSVNESPAPMSLVTLTLAGGMEVIIYPKADHQPASFTVLNFRVPDIDAAKAELEAKGVVFEHYDGLTDETGVARGIALQRGPNIAWFKDPAGNILSILQNK